LRVCIQAGGGCIQTFKLHVPLATLPDRRLAAAAGAQNAHAPPLLPASFSSTTHLMLASALRTSLRTTTRTPLSRTFTASAANMSVQKLNSHSEFQQLVRVRASHAPPRLC
jgi:hypothetical protein